MKWATIGLSALVWAPSVLGWQGLDRTIYNRWHKTDLERWLDDYNIPYPSAADRRDLEQLVADNWAKLPSGPSFDSWDSTHLSRALSKVKPDPSTDHETLVNYAKQLWADGWSKLPTDKWGDAKTWVFDSWTDSQLAAFLRHHNLVSPAEPSPTGWSRDRLLKTVQNKYDDLAASFDSAGDGYPGNWLYNSWSDSELRDWLAQHGLVPTKDPVPTTRDQLVAAVRRNWVVTRVIAAAEAAGSAAASATSAATSAAQDAKSVASESAASAQSRASVDAQLLSSRVDALLSSKASEASSAASAASRTLASAQQVVFKEWSDSKVKSWASAHNLAIPTGANRAEIEAVASRHRDAIISDASRAGTEATATLEEIASIGSATASSVLTRVTDGASSVIRQATDRLRSAFGLTSTGERVVDEIRQQLRVEL